MLYYEEDSDIVIELSDNDIKKICSLIGCKDDVVFTVTTDGKIVAIVNKEES